MKFSLVIPLAPKRKVEILKSINVLDFSRKNFEVITEEGENASRNRNNAIKKSKGEYVVFLDDDATIEKNYLVLLDNFIKEYPEVGIVGGPQISPKEANFFQELSGIALTSNFGAFRVNKRYMKKDFSLEGDETSLTSANLCIKKSVLEQIGNFNENLYPGEDPELIQRAKKSNIKIAYNPEMIIFHKRRENFISFTKQIFLYGFVRPTKDKLNQEKKWFFLIPSFFSLYLLFLTTLVLISKLFILPLLAYIILAIVFAIIDSVQNKKGKFVFFLPFLYLTIHLSYGIGMIGGYFSRK